ncbi:putative coiled-coil domain-containing protein 195 [Suricata suricatta]|uniref:putative coiled-coil domain-containing protein 195 n=1 Tax=Suricata suricatta TaxID=37032 RepID=UPI001155E93C|nr:putative coiled-coil domain-containing protein 195 [Suricata suricatta]
MEANSQFIRIIQEMRTEINKLKKENQFLRMKLTSNSPRTSGSPCRESGDEREEEVTGPSDLGKASEESPATLYSGVSTDPAPAGHKHQGNIMIVRRYSISSSVHSLAAHDPWKAGERYPKSGILEAQGRIKPLAWPSVKKQDNEEKMLVGDFLANNSFNSRAFPEHIFGNVTRNSGSSLSHGRQLHGARQRKMERSPQVEQKRQEDGRKDDCGKNKSGEVNEGEERNKTQHKESSAQDSGKMKTVSFLLPMDVSSYSKNSSSFKSSQDQTTNQLSTIAE